MILDSEARTDDWFADKTFDVCVIGSGPAGATIAHRLGARGFTVGLFEAGGLLLTPDSQDLYQGTSTGTPQYYDLTACRLRYFGGSSNHWGGWTRPLDAYDFKPKAHNPLSGWPIDRSALDIYAGEADAILHLPLDSAPADFFDDHPPELIPRLFRFSRPTTRFGELYKDDFDKSANVTVYLNANLVDMRLGDSLKTVSEAVFQSYEKPGRFSVKARAFALCLGGLEGPRFLLNANSQIAPGLGNENDLVGRYFLEHAHAPVGRVVVRQPLTRMICYSPSPEFMNEKQILNFGLRIGSFDEWNRADFTGALDPQPACTIDFDALLKAEMAGEKPACLAMVGDAFVACEQSLNPDNRVTLTDTRDRFGLREMNLNWTLSDMDRRTLKTAATQVAERMAGADVGRMRVLPWLLNDEMPNKDQVFGGNHHMGTTRMSADPKTGVVDAHCKVHALANLYVGGSSVFATSGHANPTYSITQLALRLGDHLTTVLRA